MRREYLKRRQFVGSGNESIVLRDSMSKSNRVFKIAKPFNFLAMIHSDQPKIIRQEIAEAEKKVEGTNVKIPKTRVWSGKKVKLFGTTTTPYIISQEYVEEDHTIPNITSYLIREGLNDLAEFSSSEPKNFLSHKGTVYWVDPLKGNKGRLLERVGIMKFETYRKLKRR